MVRLPELRSARSPRQDTNDGLLLDISPAPVKAEFTVCIDRNTKRCHRALLPDNQPYFLVYLVYDFPTICPTIYGSLLTRGVI